MSCKEISLNGKWKLINKERNINLEADVPGSVFYELIKGNFIEDPFYGTNEEGVKWVYLDKWLYEKSFSLNDVQMSKKNIELVFYGLDTYSEIWLNGNFILKTDNMHRTYRIILNGDRRKFLKVGENILGVHFDSSVLKAHEYLKKMNYDQKMFEKYQPGYAIPGVETIRKSYYSFGWDWGPKLPDIGIWRNVELKIFDSQCIDNVYIKPEILFADDSSRVLKAFFEIDVDLRRPNGENEWLMFKIFDPDGCLIKEHRTRGKENGLNVEITNPKLWWTHDLGEQNLYKIEVLLMDKDTIIQKKSFKAGLRKIDLVRREDSWGETFYFKINNISIFAKGANWVPVDNFIQRGREKKLYENLIHDAKRANMNMLRVWGGGLYEDDHFYDLCDESGILVWQDFAFACKPTPDYENFADNVKKEVEDNIIRLRNHPSLCIWVGNNEIEEGWLYWEFKKLCPHLKKNYVDIFEEIIPELVSKFDGIRSYWPSSPSSGGNFDDPQSPDRGDSHFWDVWHASKPFSSYKKFNSRFMSEFGFESFPDIKTIKMFCPSDQMEMFSEVMLSHQKNPSGNEKILKYMRDRFVIPDGFWKKIIVSQITQGEAIEFGVEHWRRNRNENHCMGTLYWQLNDCWPVASWSSIDYFGRWKALHYMAKRFFNPMLVSVDDEKNKIKIWITNDLKEDFRGVLKYEIFNFDGDKISENSEIIYSKKLESEIIKEFDLKEMNLNKDEIIIYNSLEDSSGKEVYRDAKFFRTPKSIPLTDPKISFNMEGESKLTVSAEENSLFVFLYSDKHDFICSDNYFHMRKNEKRIVEIEWKEKIFDKEIVNSLKIFSLYDLLK
ncbi:MAG: beta-mannosidase [Kosmotogales bacterium]|nr:beta-mannosidase [Kosmotogales bacterium]